MLPNLSNSQIAYCAGLGTTDAIIYTIEHGTKMLDDIGIKAVEVLFKDFVQISAACKASEIAS